MGKTRGIKDRAKKIFASPVYSTIVLVPLLIVVILVSAAVIMAVERSSESSYKWTYYDAVYYIVTLVTTIGYGNYIPHTNGGKILTIFYIVLFVPLTMLTMAKAGQCLTLVFKHLWIAICGCLGKKNATGKVSLPLVIPVTILLIYILVGAAIFFAVEMGPGKVSYLEMLYFVFVSLGTIGFGDIRPIKQDIFPFFVIYMFCGLMIVAMCINVGFFDSVNDESEQKNGNDKTTQNEDKLEEVTIDLV